MLHAEMDPKVLEHALDGWIRLVLTPRKVIEQLRFHDPTIAQQETNPLGEASDFCMANLAPCPPQALQHTLRWLEASDNHRVLVHCVAAAANPFDSSAAQDSLAGYPSLLRETHRPPWLLFCDGDIRLLEVPLLAMVGSRRATPYGLEQTARFSRGLVQAGWGICSGMAMGVDGAAHRAALDAGGSTVAVLGTGPDICYPPRQRALYQQLRRDGLLVSEFIPGAQARSDHFLRRNRIISGLSHAVMVCEATVRSGSLSTARFAIEHNRQVLALPGPVTQLSYAGNHRLIQQGAALVTDVKDVLAELPSICCKQGLEDIALRPDIEGHGSKPASLANAPMLANVGFETTSIDRLVELSQLPVGEVMNQLITLELDGWVTAVPGGYVRVRRE